MLPATMYRVVNHGIKDYRLETVALPKPGDNELLLKVGACGICASDVHCYHGAPMYWGNDQTPAWVKTPVVVGHEFFGEVVAAGPGALTHFNTHLGAKVIPEQIIPCNRCRFCRDGKYWMCEVHNIYGFQGGVADGGMAEYMLVKANSRLHSIPAALTADECALIEPFACAFHAVNRASIEFHDVVVLAGAGPLGLGMVQALRLKTPRKIIVLDTLPARLAMAHSLGADVVMNPREQDVVAEVKRLTDGYGCDVYIDATGHPSAVKNGLDMIRKLGRYVEFSVFSEAATVDWSIIGDRKELDIRGAHLGPEGYQTVIDLFMRKRITAEGIISARYSFKEWETAFKQAESSDTIKVLLTPDNP